MATNAHPNQRKHATTSVYAIHIPTIPAKLMYDPTIFFGCSMCRKHHEEVGYERTFDTFRMRAENHTTLTSSILPKKKNKSPTRKNGYASSSSFSSM